MIPFDDVIMHLPVSSSLLQSFPDRPEAGNVWQWPAAEWAYPDEMVRSPIAKKNPDKSNMGETMCGQQISTKSEFG